MQTQYTPPLCSALKQYQKLNHGEIINVNFKNRDYLLFEGRIIDEREADRIYTIYHKANQDAGTVQVDTTSSYAQWKKDETMLLTYIVMNVADQRDTLVENFSDADWQTVANLVPGRTSS